MCSFFTLPVYLFLGGDGRDARQRRLSRLLTEFLKHKPLSQHTGTTGAT